MIATAEALLALRAPGADWLATLITALDESSRDPAFSPHLAEVFARLAQQSATNGELPAAVIEAAHRRTQEFAQRLSDDIALDDCIEDQMPEPVPHLTLVVG